MFGTTEKEILIIVTVQSFLLIPLKVTLQAWQYRRRWWNPLFDKQLALGYCEKLVVERILGQSTDWLGVVEIASYKRLKRYWLRKSVTWWISLVLSLAPLGRAWFIEVVAVAATVFLLKKGYPILNSFIKNQTRWWRTGK